MPDRNVDDAGQSADHATSRKEEAVAAERLSMRKLREILRLHLEMGLGPRAIVARRP